MPDQAKVDLMSRLSRQRVLVVGDVMLDVYQHGTASRLCPETPVPVVQLQRQTWVPGGAANAAANVAGLQAKVVLVGVCGADESGERLATALAEQGVNTHGLLLDASRPTTTKTRILAQNRQVVRVDVEDSSPLLPPLLARLLEVIDNILPTVDACLLSDYAKGVVSHALARHLINKARGLGKPVVVDPKGSDASKYCGATLVKPNLHEAALLLRREVNSPEEAVAANCRLLDLFGGTTVLITCGAAGMFLLQADSQPIHIAALAREVFDVTGAGDTVAATLAVALAAGGTAEQAARLASRAAAVIVGRPGTAAIRLADLLTAVHHTPDRTPPPGRA